MRFNRSEAPSHRIRTIFEFCNNPCIYTYTSTNLARFTIVKRRLFEKRVFWHHCLRSKVRRPCRKVWEIEWLTQECELRRSIATCTKCHSFSTVGLLTRVLEDGFYVWPATLGEWLASVCVLFNVRWWDSLGLSPSLSLRRRRTSASNGGKSAQAFAGRTRTRPGQTIRGPNCIIPKIFLHLWSYECPIFFTRPILPDGPSL